MNPHLDLLLSAVYSGALAPGHRDDLSASGLSEDTIAAARIRSVPPSMIKPLLGFDLPAITSAYVIPYRSPGGGFMPHVRLKIFPSLTDARGHTVKYLQPKGAPPRLYFPPGDLADILGDDEPLWVIEGEKKCLAIRQLGKPAVGIAGVEGWHRRGTDRLLPDFDDVRLEGRIVEVLPDGDVKTNAEIRRAVDRFGRALAARGALPRLVHLPERLSR